MARRTKIQPYVNSISFNGSTSYLAKATPTGVNTGTNSRFGMVRMFLTSDALGGIFTYKCNSAQSPGLLVGQLAGTYYFALDSINAGNNLTMTAAEFKRYFPVGQWIEFAWLITNTTISIWSNHVLVKSATAWGVAINTGTYDNIFWGKSQTSTQTDVYPFSGLLKDGIIGNGTITQADVDNFFYDGTLPAGVTDRWAMSEGSGTAVASTGSNSMTASNITWSTSTPMRARSANSQQRQAILYTPYSMVGAASTTSGLTIPNNATLNPTAAVTVRIRFMKSGPNTYFSLFDNSEGGITNSYFFDYYEGSGFRWYSVIGGSARNITTTAFRAPYGVWIDAIATYTGSAIYIYVNGVKLPEEITGISGALGTNSGPLRIGRTWNALAAGAFRGYLHRPMIFNVGCTLQEAQDMYFANKFSAALTAGKILDITTNDGSGTTPVDASSTGAVATMGAAMSWTSEFTPFKIPTAIRPYNYSLSFNGSNQYVDLGNGGSISQASTAFSVGAWFKQEAIAGGSIITIVGDQGAASARFYLQFVDSQFRAAIATNGTSANFTGSTRYFTNGVWNRVDLTWDGTNARSYINAVLDQTLTCNGTCSASTAGMAIGRGFGPSRYWPGKIARVQYWNARALSQEEISKIYKAGADSSSASIRSGMTGEWKLNEGSGSTAIDTFGLNNGTITGATYSTDVPYLVKTAI